MTEVTESSPDFQEIDLKNSPITIPNEGLFVGILFLGKSNETVFPPFKERITTKGLYKFPYSIDPPLPITGEIAEERSFMRSSFNNNTWSSFTKVYSVYGLLKNYPFLNLGLGYELEMH